MKIGINTLALSVYISIAMAHFQFTPIADNVTMIISKLSTAHLTYDPFKLVYFADLTPLYRLKQNTKIAITTVKNLTATLNKPIYTTAAGQLDHQMNTMYAHTQRIDSMFDIYSV